MDELLLELANSTSRKSLKRKVAGDANKEHPNLEEEDELIAKFRLWIHDPIEPEKRLESFRAESRLGNRVSCSSIVKIQNLFPEEVANGKSLRMSFTIKFVDYYLMSTFITLNQERCA